MKGRCGWRPNKGVICDTRIAAGVKGKLYRTVVRTALMYCFMTVARRKRREAEMELSELKMVSFFYVGSVQDGKRLELTMSEGQLGLSGLETKLDR